MACTAGHFSLRDLLPDFSMHLAADERIPPGVSMTKLLKQRLKKTGLPMVLLMMVGISMAMLAYSRKKQWL